MAKSPDKPLGIVTQVVSGFESSNKKDGTKAVENFDIFSDDMAAATEYDLTYGHELGLGYTFIRPDLIVGSYLKTIEGLSKIISLPSKVRYLGVGISAIHEYASKCGDIEHLRAEIRDRDAFDLRLRLPAIVSKLNKAINRNGGVTYIHCTAGHGRAPSVANKRSCFPKLDAVKCVTVDIITGPKKMPVTMTWYGDSCTTVEISGLDIGWDQRIPLEFDAERGLWILHRELPEGHYEYKYIVDGEWTCNEFEPITSPNKDGHVNNYVEVLDDINPDSISAAVRKRLTGMTLILLQTKGS